MGSPRTFVVGDIHGCLEEVEYLLEALSPNTDDKIIFLGDYIDRGPSSRGVIDRLLRLQKEGPHCVFLKGNHEDMFLDFLGLGGRHGAAFLINGGQATLRSYGLGVADPHSTARELPRAHIEFLQNLELRYEHEGFLCVHAGLDPSLPLDRQREEDLLWIRDPWTKSRHPFNCTVVFGHTPQREVLADLPYKIGIDTGLVYGRCLTALELPAYERHQIRRRSRSVVRSSLPRATTQR